MVEDLKALNSYSLSGHSVIMERGKHDWQETKYVPARFVDSLKEPENPLTPAVVIKP